MTPITPETDPVCTLDFPAAGGLFKTFSCLVLTAILNCATPQTLVTRPDCAIPEVTIASDFWSECLSTQTVTCGLQQSGVLRVITARDFQLLTADQPECWRDHVSVAWWISCFSCSDILVVPPVTTVLHPVFSVGVWEPSDKSPTFASRHMAIHLWKQENFLQYWDITARTS